MRKHTGAAHLLFGALHPGEESESHITDKALHFTFPLDCGHYVQLLYTCALARLFIEQAIPKNL